MFKRKKGFSLFTALVSLLLISISLILIFNMLKTEDTYLSMIEDQSSNSDLITIADLARADAFNSFVISLRVEWENFRNKPDNSINLGREDIDLNWDSFVDKVAKDYFFDRKFNEFFATTLINKLEYTQDVIGYKVKVDSNNSTTDPSKTLGAVIGVAFQDAGNKVDVVNCKQESESSCTGSFYFKFSTINLSEENFEYLPTVTVIRFKNNEVIQRPVLSRGLYKIYMPWRGFQAMRVARRIATSPEVEMSENPVLFDIEENLGLFNPLLHNSFEQARLGVCDPGSCAPRTSFFKTVDVDGFNESCSSSYPVEGEEENFFSATSQINIFTPKVDYTLGNVGYDDVISLFNQMVINTVSDNLDSRSGSEGILFTKSLKMYGDALSSYQGPIILPLEKQIIIDRINTKISSRATKNITEVLVNQGISSIELEEFNPSNINSISGGLGLFYDEVTKRGKQAYEIDNRYNDGVLDPAPLESSNLKCYELDDSTGISYNLIFQETNSKYIVGTNQPKIYINLQDGYSGFTYPSDQQSSFFINTAFGYIEPYPTEIIPDNSLDAQNKWMCDDYKSGAEDAACYQRKEP